MALKLDLSGLFGPAGSGRLTRAAFEAALPRAKAARAAHHGAAPAWQALPRETRYLERCRRRADAVTAAGGVEALVVLGIGGSALGAAATAAALCPVFQEWRPLAGRPRLFVFDSLDPDWIGEALEALPLDRCHFNVVSKSGATLETAAQFVLFHEAVVRACGSAAAARERFTVTTDPAGGHFRSLCDSQGFATLEVPPGVGGRFSVLSPVGLFPALVTGVEAGDLLAGARRTLEKLAGCAPEEDPALAWALAHVLYLEEGRNVHVHFPYSHRLRLLADWFRQLWAESLGKQAEQDGAVRRTGATPVKAVGPTDQHSQVQLYAEGPRDKVFTFLKLGRFGRSVVLPDPFCASPAFEHLPGRSLEEIMEAERKGTESALVAAGQPCCVLELCKLDAFHLGQYYLFFEVATAYAGALLGVNPYDQPGVEAGKEAALALMGFPGLEQRAQEIRAAAAVGERFQLTC